MVSAVRSKLPAGRVGNLTSEGSVEPPAAARIEHRHHDLDPPTEVSGPPIRRADQIFVGAAVAEVVDAAVLQETSEEAAHPDPLRHSGHARPKRAEPADHQIDLGPRARGLVERLNDLGIVQSVELGADAADTAARGLRRFPPDAVEQRRQQVLRRHQQPTKRGTRSARAPGELVEEVVEILAQHRIGREQAKIGVEPGRAGIVVAGSHMGVAPDPALLLPHDEGYLRVVLETDEPVDHLRAGLLELLHPGDVARFVPARLELDEGGHLLPLPGRAGQRLHHRRPLARAVQCKPDGHDCRVVGRFVEQAEHGRGEILVGVVHQQIAPAEALPERGRRAQRIACRERRKEPPGYGEGGQPAEIHRREEPPHVVHDQPPQGRPAVASLEPELLHQHFAQNP